MNEEVMKEEASNEKVTKEIVQEEINNDHETNYVHKQYSVRVPNNELTPENSNAEWFRILGPASFIYAIIYTICIYKNIAGITVPIWVGCTVAYSVYIMRKLGIRMKRDGIFAIIAMILLGVSTFLTGNIYIIWMNYVGFFLLLVSWLIHNYYEDSGWSLGKNMLEITRSVFGAMSCISTALLEGCEYVREKRKGKSEKGYYILLGALIAIPCVCILGMLLSSADAVFANLIEGAFRKISYPGQGIGVLCMLVFGFFSSYCGMRFLSARNQLKKEGVRTQQEPVIAITFTSVLTLVYLLFSGIQIIYLFLGYGVLPEGMTYATYARTGFFQLLFVSIINLFLVLAIKYYFKNNRILNGLLLTICGCTLVMIASSVYRMLLYIGVYHLTFLRVFVLVALGVISLMMVGVVIWLFSSRFPLYRYGLVVISVIYIGFSFCHVDYFIASYNLSHMTENTMVETLEYIGTLSTDAAPAIMNYLNQESELKEKIKLARKAIQDGDMQVLYSSSEDISWYLWYEERTKADTSNVGIRTFNLSHYSASKNVW